MGKKRIYGLDRDQIGRLLSLGTKGPQVGEEEGNESASTEGTSSEKTASLKACAERPGGWVGRYKLLRVLGEGGMGLVFLARQEHALQRQVALKVIKPGMDSRRVMGRFKAERQALALLDHPNIAHVYDAGTTDSHRPYFVMEYVKGLPITEYCDRNKLTIDDRLRLFQQVCHAVQHAHQKGIIHRDLKPSNILVAVEGERPIPKIIDFGVAKAISQSSTEGTVFTEDNRLLGTPEYMSPEQADAASEDIDTRSDIYSLGVLLYELVTGILPFDAATLRGGGLDHVRRIIRETDPKTPSTRLTKLGEEAKEVAESRRTEVAVLAKRLRQELEWIPLKAMRKERDRRYQSASELAGDIENYLKGAPLIAGPPGAAYRFQKFVRRHRALMVGTAALLAVLVVGIVVSTHFALGQARARTDAEATVSFLRNVLTGVSSVSWSEAKLCDVIDQAAENLETEFSDRPLVRASIHREMATMYGGMGEYRKALLQWQRANQIYLAESGEELSRHFAALAYVRMGRYQEAEVLFLKAIRSSGQLDAEGNPVPHPEYPFGCCHLAGVYRGQGRYQEAEDLIRRALAGARGWGPMSQWRLYYTGSLAGIVQDRGRYEEAEQLYTTILKAQCEHNGIGETHRNTVSTMRNLARLYVRQRRYDEAQALLDKALTNSRANVGEEHPQTLVILANLGVLCTKKQAYEEANTFFRQALEVQQRKLGDDHPATLRTVNDLGVLRREQGQYEEAKELLTQALEGRRAKLGPDHPACFESMHELALLHITQKDYDGAELLLLEAFHGREAKLGSDHPHTIKSLNQLVRLYESWSKPEEAAKWRAKLPRKEDAQE